MYYRDPRRRRDKEGSRKLTRKKIVSENFLNLRKLTDIQVQEAQRPHNEMSSGRSTPRHIIIKMMRSNNKESILKAYEKRKQLYSRETHKVSI